jgi:protein transport protein SEC24
MPGGVAAPVHPGPGSMAPGMAPQHNVYQENIDFNISIPDRFFRMTCDKIPATNNVAIQAKVPLGGVVRPLAPCPEGEEEVDTIQPGSAGIIRCKRCRTYVNAFVHWIDHGRSWRCNICAQVNNTPSAYFCHLDDEGFRSDRFERPELSKSVVEFIAPAEYMVRPPQEPTYFFVLDVSAQAVHSGMLESAANAIKRSLDDLPGGRRTKIGFITFDNSVHYFNLASDLAQPQMLVVSSLRELFVPLPDNLLVNLQESRSVVDSFLDSLPEMFVKNPIPGQSCLGPALKAAFTVMKQVGGKMLVFQSIQPNMGDGALKPRENPAIMGSGSEVKLLRSDSEWYKDTAIEFSRQQISVDMFLFPYSYIDLASLGDLPKYSSGSLHSYVMFNFEKDGPRFEEQLHKTLTTDTAFEAVMRTRVTKGMRISNYYGNFFIRGSDLMALPNVNSDSVFGFDLAHDGENLASNYVTVQSALLYTNGHGQRRIRVMTQAFPTTSLTSELANGVDVFATCNLMAKQAIDVALKTTLDNARMRMQQTCVDLIRSAKGGDVRTVSGYAVPQAPQSNPTEDDSLPPALELFPLYTLALMKNVAFRGGTDVHPDERSQAFFNINQMWVNKSKSFIYPPLFSLHDMQPNAGYSSEENTDDALEDSFAGRDRIVLPNALPLTIDSLSSDGIYLVDNGIEFYLWIGREAHANYVNALFGVHSLENVEPVLNLESGDEFSKRIGSIISALRDDEADPFTVSSKISVVKEGDPHMEARFFWFMVEDRASFQGGTFSYEDFMNFVQNPNVGPGGPAPPGGPGGGSMIPQRRGPGVSPQPIGHQPMGGPPPPAQYGQPSAQPMARRGPLAPPQQQQYGQPMGGPPPPAQYGQPSAPPMARGGPPAPPQQQQNGQPMGGPPPPAQYGQTSAPPMARGGPAAPPQQQQYGQGPPQPAYGQPRQHGQGPPSAPYSGGMPAPPKPSVPAPPGRATQHNASRRSPPPPPRGRGPPPPPPPPPR